MMTRRKFYNALSRLEGFVVNGEHADLIRLEKGGVCFCPITAVAAASGWEYRDSIHAHLGTMFCTEDWEDAAYFLEMDREDAELIVEAADQSIYPSIRTALLRRVEALAQETACSHS